MAKVELDQVFPYRDNNNRFKIKTRKCTMHSELISFIGKYYDTIDREVKENIFVISFFNVAMPVYVKSDYSTLLSLMNDQPFYVVDDGSGGTSGSGSSGSGYSGEGSGSSGTCTAYSSSLVTNFNGACQAAISQTYYHNGSVAFPQVGNRVYSDSGCTTVLSDGYYSINGSVGGTGTDFIRVINGFVEAITECIDQVPEP